MNDVYNMKINKVRSYVPVQSFFSIALFWFCTWNGNCVEVGFRKECSLLPNRLSGCHTTRFAWHPDHWLHDLVTRMFLKIIPLKMTYYPGFCQTWYSLYSYTGHKKGNKMMVSFTVLVLALHSFYSKYNKKERCVTLVFLLKIMWHTGLFWWSTFPHACRGRTAVLFPTQLNTFVVWSCHLKGCLRHPPGMLATPCWWDPVRPKQLCIAANWPGEMVVRMCDVLATPGWCLCQLAFLVVL